MTAAPFPELAVIAKIENVEAVAQNIEEAILFEVAQVAATGSLDLPALDSAPDCAITLGDNAVERALAKIMRTLCAVMAEVLRGLEGLAARLADTIREVIASVIDSISRAVGDIVSALTAAISDAVAGLAATVSRIIDTIVETLASIVDAITEQVAKIVAGLQDIIGAIFNKISDVVEAIFNKISDVFTGLLEAATAVFDAIKGGVTAVLDALLNAAEFVFQRIGGALTGLIETLTGVAEGGLAKIREVIESIPATLREVFEEATAFVGDAVGKPLDRMGEIIITQVEAFFAKMIDDLDLSPDRIIREFLTGLGIPADEADRFASAADRAMPRTPGVFVIALAAVIPFLLPPLITTILSPALEQVRQEVAQRVTPTLIPPANAVDAFLRGTMTESQFREDLSQAGYNTERQDILVATSRRLLGLGELFRWWLRGLIDDDQLDEQLAMQHIESNDRVLLKEAAFFIPPVGDLIRMAVREVFSPDIRERFGQDEGFPEELAEFGRQQGLSEFWARAFWAAHWTLPSPQQGFEMLHRKVIDSDDLDLLLRAQDVMPFWRDKLVQIAFNPLTRVDLRRMHRLGLLDEEQLQLRYEDLGFAADNAALMVKFTLAFNVTDETEAEQEIEGLTRATVVNMMEDGILSEGEALEILATMGLSERVASLFVEQRKLDVERRDRKALIENVIRLVGGGIINFPAAQDSLAQLGLTAVEIARATQRIVAALGGRDRLPTPAQLDKMLASEIIDEDLWKETMEGMNFPNVWIERILELNQSGGVA